MPTYEYQCDACGEKFERFQSITAAPVKTCPACHKHKVRRLIGAGAGLIFKGSGFYITDYRSDSYKSSASADSSSSSSSTNSSTSSSSSTSQNKPAASAGSKSNGNSAKTK